MILRIKDFLAIGIALLAIFFSGYGVGFLLGEKKGKAQSEGPIFVIPQDHQTTAWKESTLEKLSKSLELNRRQKKLIAEEIQVTSMALTKAYYQSSEIVLHEQLKLLKRILPHLTSEQREILDIDRKKLEEKLN